LGPSVGRVSLKIHADGHYGFSCDEPWFDNMHYIVEYDGMPVVIRGWNDNAVPTETTTWGELKSLYR
jgi:hypothetical protein